MVKKRKKTPLILPIFLLVCIGVFILPTIVFICGAMLPSLVAMLTSNANKTYKWVCITGLNLAGMLPFLFEFWKKVQDMTSVYNVLLDIPNLIAIYSSAGIGWLLYISVPPIIISIIAFMDKHKVKKLKHRQERLLKLWGNKVSEELF